MKCANWKQSKSASPRRTGIWRRSALALEDPAVTGDPPRLKAACIEMDEAQNALDLLYARWAELEKKKAGD